MSNYKWSDWIERDPDETTMPEVLQGIISAEDFEFKCGVENSILKGVYANDWDCTHSQRHARITHYRYKIFNQNKETKKVIKFIDQGEQDEVIEAFAYTDHCGRTEMVVNAGEHVSIMESTENDEVLICKEDIPKLIKALEAAHKEWGE